MTTTETETARGTLTREHISYIKRADDIYAAHRSDQFDTTGNVVACVKRGAYGDRFSSDVTVEIPVAGNGAPGWFAPSIGHRFEPNAWQLFVRTGDRLALRWGADDGTNGHARDAGIHVDYLYLDVERGEGKARKRYRFLVAVSTCPDNSARMCHGAPERRI